MAVMRLAPNSCPECSGILYLDYKNTWWKCCGCSREFIPPPIQSDEYREITGKAEAYGKERDDERRMQEVQE